MAGSVEESSVRPGLPSGDHAEMLKDAAHDPVGLALAAQEFELVHDPVQRDLDLAKRAGRIAVALTLQTLMAAFEFLAIELRKL